MAEEDKKSWIRPNDVMNLYKLKIKKKALQARMNRTCVSRVENDFNISSPDTSTSVKRKNPFIRNDENKKPKHESFSEESSDSTLFKLINLSSAPALSKIQSTENSPLISFTSVLNKLNNRGDSNTFVTNQGEPWIPIDWALNTKLRLISAKPFAWNRKLKTSEEASGITGFVRCLDTRHNTSLDTSPNAQFHQCCLFWQHPSLPWLNLFPRTQGRVSGTSSITSTTVIKEKLQAAWANSLQSLFQLVRARQCPYFYVCANTFTAVFRAAGICGYSEMHVLLTPTTRGFRQVLRQEDIQFTLPLKKNKRNSSDGTNENYDTLDGSNIQDTQNEAVDPDIEDDETEEQWLQSMGINAEDIKKINNVQARITHKAECEIDNSEQSLIFVEGVEAHALYNFLINCKSIVTLTGPLAGVPPTLLAPVAFHGACLHSLKVRENKVFDNNVDYYSLELNGPILPHTIHNLFSLLPKENSVTATFANIPSTATLSKIKSPASDSSDANEPANMAGSAVFGQENLSDCGFNKEILKHFCSNNPNHVQHIDSLKYTNETGLYTWL